jgi:tetraprenyl-beta-curcumene synthase
MSSSTEPFADRWLMARASFALLLANVRYWSTVALLVRAQLSHWEHRAETIADPWLSRAAIGKLRDQRFNVESAATLATLAPRAHRAGATKAIVALQVMYDYLDLLGEQPPAESPSGGRQLFTAFRDAITLEQQTDGGSPERQAGGDYYRDHPQSDDGGYLEELVRTTRLELSRLPAAAAVAAAAQESARRCIEAQMLGHAAIHAGTAELEQWARREAADTDLRWPEYLAGAAASVLAVHALIAAAADTRTTSRDAAEIDAAYLSIGALTMLDSLIDRDEDIATGELGYARFYESREAMASALLGVAKDTKRKALRLRHAAHHVMILVGIVAYYASAPTAENAFARPVTARLCHELRPLITPTLALMRTWRLAKRAHRALWHGSTGPSPRPGQTD